MHPSRYALEHKDTKDDYGPNSTELNRNRSNVSTYSANRSSYSSVGSEKSIDSTSRSYQDPQGAQEANGRGQQNASQVLFFVGSKSRNSINVAKEQHDLNSRFQHYPFQPLLPPINSSQTASMYESDTQSEELRIRPRVSTSKSSYEEPLRKENSEEARRLDVAFEITPDSPSASTSFLRAGPPSQLEIADSDSESGSDMDGHDRELELKSLKSPSEHEGTSKKASSPRAVQKRTGSFSMDPLMSQPKPSPSQKPDSSTTFFFPPISPTRMSLSIVDATSSTPNQISQSQNVAKAQVRQADEGRGVLPTATTPRTRQSVVQWERQQILQHEQILFSGNGQSSSRSPPQGTKKVIIQQQQQQSSKSQHNTPPQFISRTPPLLPEFNANTHQDNQRQTARSGTILLMPNPQPEFAQLPPSRVPPPRVFAGKNEIKLSMGLGRSSQSRRSSEDTSSTSSGGSRNSSPSPAPSRNLTPQPSYSYGYKAHSRSSTPRSSFSTAPTGRGSISSRSSSNSNSHMQQQQQQQQQKRKLQAQKKKRVEAMGFVPSGKFSPIFASILPPSFVPGLDSIMKRTRDAICATPKRALANALKHILHVSRLLQAYKHIRADTIIVLQVFVDSPFSQRGQPPSLILSSASAGAAQVSCATQLQFDRTVDQFLSSFACAVGNPSDALNGGHEQGDDYDEDVYSDTNTRDSRRKSTPEDITVWRDRAYGRIQSFSDYNGAKLPEPPVGVPLPAALSLLGHSRGIVLNSLPDHLIARPSKVLNNENSAASVAMSSVASALSRSAQIANSLSSTADRTLSTDGLCSTGATLDIPTIPPVAHIMTTLDQPFDTLLHACIARSGLSIPVMGIAAASAKSSGESEFSGRKESDDRSKSQQHRTHKRSSSTGAPIVGRSSISLENIFQVTRKAGLARKASKLAANITNSLLEKYHEVTPESIAEPWRVLESAQFMLSSGQSSQKTSFSSSGLDNAKKDAKTLWKLVKSNLQVIVAMGANNMDALILGRTASQGEIIRDGNSLHSENQYNPREQVFLAQSQLNDAENGRYVLRDPMTGVEINSIEQLLMLAAPPPALLRSIKRELTESKLLDERSPTPYAASSQSYVNCLKSLSKDVHENLLANYIKSPGKQANDTLSLIETIMSAVDVTEQASYESYAASQNEVYQGDSSAELDFAATTAPKFEILPPALGPGAHLIPESLVHSQPYISDGRLRSEALQIPVVNDSNSSRRSLAPQDLLPFCLQSDYDIASTRLTPNGDDEADSEYDNDLGGAGSWGVGSGLYFPAIADELTELLDDPSESLDRHSLRTDENTEDLQVLQDMVEKLSEDDKKLIISTLRKLRHTTAPFPARHLNPFDTAIASEYLVSRPRLVVDVVLTFEPKPCNKVIPTANGGGSMHSLNGKFSGSLGETFNSELSNCTSLCEYGKQIRVCRHCNALFTHDSSIPASVSICRMGRQQVGDQANKGDISHMCYRHMEELQTIPLQKDELSLYPEGYKERKVYLCCGAVHPNDVEVELQAERLRRLRIRLLRRRFRGKVVEDGVVDVASTVNRILKDSDSDDQTRFIKQALESLKSSKASCFFVKYELNEEESVILRTNALFIPYIIENGVTDGNSNSELTKVYAKVACDEDDWCPADGEDTKTDKTTLEKYRKLITSACAMHPSHEGPLIAPPRMRPMTRSERSLSTWVTEQKRVAAIDWLLLRRRRAHTSSLRLIRIFDSAPSNSGGGNNRTTQAVSTSQSSIQAEASILSACTFASLLSSSSSPWYTVEYSVQSKGLTFASLWSKIVSRFRRQNALSKRKLSSLELRHAQTGLPVTSLVDLENLFHLQNTGMTSASSLISSLSESIGLKRSDQVTPGIIMSEALLTLLTRPLSVDLILADTSFPRPSPVISSLPILASFALRSALLPFVNPLISQFAASMPYLIHRAPLVASPSFLRKLLGQESIFKASQRCKRDHNVVVPSILSYIKDNESMPNLITALTISTSTASFPLFFSSQFPSILLSSGALSGVYNFTAGLNSSIIVMGSTHTSPADMIESPDTKSMFAILNRLGAGGFCLGSGIVNSITMAANVDNSAGQQNYGHLLVAVSMTSATATNSRPQQSSGNQSTSQDIPSVQINSLVVPKSTSSFCDLTGQITGLNVQIEPSVPIIKGISTATTNDVVDDETDSLITEEIDDSSSTRNLSPPAGVLTGGEDLNGFFSAPAWLIHGVPVSSALNLSSLLLRSIDSKNNPNNNGTWQNTLVPFVREDQSQDATCSDISLSSLSKRLVQAAVAINPNLIKTADPQIVSGLSGGHSPFIEHIFDGLSRRTLTGQDMTFWKGYEGKSSFIKVFRDTSTNLVSFENTLNGRKWVNTSIPQLQNDWPMSSSVPKRLAELCKSYFYLTTPSHFSKDKVLSESAVMSDKQLFVRDLFSMTRHPLLSSLHSVGSELIDAVHTSDAEEGNLKVSVISTLGGANTGADDDYKSKDVTKKYGLESINVDSIVSSIEPNVSVSSGAAIASQIASCGGHVALGTAGNLYLASPHKVTIPQTFVMSAWTKQEFASVVRICNGCQKLFRLIDIPQFRESIVAKSGTEGQKKSKEFYVPPITVLPSSLSYIKCQCSRGPSMTSIFNVLYPLFFDLEMACIHVVPHISLSESVLRTMAVREQHARAQIAKKVFRSDQPRPSVQLNQKFSYLNKMKMHLWNSSANSHKALRFSTSKPRQFSLVKVQLESKELEVKSNETLNSDSILSYWLEKEVHLASQRSTELKAKQEHGSRKYVSTESLGRLVLDEIVSADVASKSKQNYSAMRSLQVDLVASLKLLSENQQLSWSAIQVEIEHPLLEVKEINHQSVNRLQIIVPAGTNSLVTMNLVKQKIVLKLQKQLQIVRVQQYLTQLQNGLEETTLPFNNDLIESILWASLDALQVSALPDNIVPAELQRGVYTLCESLVQLTWTFITSESLLTQQPTRWEKNSTAPLIETLYLARMSLGLENPTIGILKSSPKQASWYQTNKQPELSLSLLREILSSTIDVLVKLSVLDPNSNENTLTPVIQELERSLKQPTTTILLTYQNGNQPVHAINSIEASKTSLIIHSLSHLFASNDSPTNSISLNQIHNGLFLEDLIAAKTSTIALKAKFL